jgi:hypothetical protein
MRAGFDFLGREPVQVRWDMSIRISYMDLYLN